MAGKPIYRPGEIVPDSGICEAIGPRGGKRDYQTTVEENEVFPPTEQSGDQWVFIKKTRHKPKK